MRSSLLGLVCGVLLAPLLLTTDGATGLWAREIGWQVSEQLTRLRAEAEARNVPELARTARSRARALYQQAAAELAALDEATGLRARASALLGRVWAAVAERAEASGVAAKVAPWAQRAYNASGIEAWRRRRASENIERRRQHAQAA